MAQEPRSPSEVLQTLGPPVSLSCGFLAALDALWSARYTGSVEVHFKDGKPRKVHLAVPVHITVEEHAP